MWRYSVVELEGFEPSSRQSIKELSTCLAHILIVGWEAGIRADLPPPYLRVSYAEDEEITQRQPAGLLMCGNDI
jgi:hypothetical protein